MLNPHSMAILHLMLMRYYPKQPDKPVGISYNEIERITNYGKATISRCLKELEALEFITLYNRGRFRGKKSEYIINPELALRYVDDPQ